MYLETNVKCYRNFIKFNKIRLTLTHEFTIKKCLPELKSHDCHILMQQLLSVAIRDILPNKVKLTITRLCFFLNAICSKVLNLVKLDELENEPGIILCQLEVYFPPAFFDIMVHLIVHLVREIKCFGLVYLWWMYPVYMKILKGIPESTPFGSIYYWTVHCKRSHWIFFRVYWKS